METGPSKKKRVIREGRKILAITVYLALFLAGFTVYKRIVLAGYDVVYVRFGYILFEAAALAKIVAIGHALRVGSRFDGKPLILPTLYKTFLFSIIVLCFSVGEHLIAGLVKGTPTAEIFTGILEQKHEILARTVVVLVAFIPLFALWETGRVIGESKLFDLFFKRRSA